MPRTFAKMRLSIFSLSLFLGTNLEFLEDMDPNLKKGCMFEVYIEKECFLKNSCLAEKISLNVSIWAEIAMTNITMRRLNIASTGSK